MMQSGCAFPDCQSRGNSAGNQGYSRNREIFSSSLCLLSFRGGVALLDVILGQLVMDTFSGVLAIFSIGISKYSFVKAKQPHSW